MLDWEDANSEFGSKSRAGNHTNLENVSRKRIVFKLLGKVIAVRRPPWRTYLPDYYSISIPPFVNHRSVTALWAVDGVFSTACNRARVIAWGITEIAHLSLFAEHHLFLSSGYGRELRLIPQPRSSVPLQWSHYGPGAIPNALADMRCSTLGPDLLLALLNDVTGTRYTLDMVGLESCLAHVLHTSPDFGHAYGSLRRRWLSRYSWQLLPDVLAQQQRDEEARQAVLSDGYLKTSRVLPRRVWDLYSNRVLSFHVLGSNFGAFVIPENLWTVSHSWVHENSRTHVLTPINGYEWPVPVPAGTTLDHIRVELLNLGAEYVWLDVLSLRQRGQPERETLRAEEWKLDVPTIGYIYSLHAPCITYFNGLGLPLDPSPETLSSDRHWLKRAWTVQEGTESWLLGGGTGDSSEDAKAFFKEYRRSRRIPTRMRGHMIGQWYLAIRAMRERHCTTELDKVHGLAYILQCETLPVYEEGMSPSLAWLLLLKHLHPFSRSILALLHLRQRPDDTALLPSWNDFLQYEPDPKDNISHYFVPTLSWLQMADSSQLGAPSAATYIHKVVSFGTFRVFRYGSQEGPIGTERVELRLPNDSDVCYIVPRCTVGGMISHQALYTILLMSGGAWIAAEVTARREMWGESILEVIKQAAYSPRLWIPNRRVPL